MADPVTLNHMQQLLPLGIIGAIGAAVATGWSHVKGFFNYVSTFIMLDASYTELGGEAIRRYLKGSGKYRRLPGGKIQYTITALPMVDKKVEDYRVPFRHKLSDTNIFLGRYGLIFVTFSSVTCTVRGIRGLMNTDAFLLDALEWTRKEFSNSATSRFRVINYVGEEKGLVSQMRPKQSRGELSDSVESASNSVGVIDYDLDHSIRYERSQFVRPRESDPFADLYYDEEVMRHIQDIKTWSTQGEWYRNRGIIHRRGVLWEGPAGTGKSSIVRATAEALGFPLYVYHLSTLSDQEFLERWETMDTPCVALFEDIDTVFNKRESLTHHKSLTFECLLNAISGVRTLSGTLLMVTTNHIDKVDEALKDRPGRIDVVVNVGAMNETNRRRMANRILADWPHLIEKAVAEGEGEYPVVFGERCTRLALSELAKNKGLPPATDTGVKIRRVA